MENLLEARISLWVAKDEIKRARAPNNDWLQDNVVLRFANVGKLMNVIRNVRYLIICVDTLEVVSLCCESMPVFKNLKSLTIESNWWQAWQAWQAIPALLRNCPHLETLVIGGKHVHRALYFEFMLSGSLAQCHREMRVFLSLRFSRGQRR